MKNQKFTLLKSYFLKHMSKTILYVKNTWYFNKINEEKNADRVKDFASNLNTFKKIYKNANDIMQKNGYNDIKFYVVLFFFNYYDKSKFSQMMKKLLV